MFEQKK